jgi:hypothetical protein
MVRHRVLMNCVVLLLVADLQAQITMQHGKTLSELINNLYGGDGIQLKNTGHQAHFGESGDFQNFSKTLQAVLQSRPVFPIPSAVGLVSYRFNEQTGTYERVEGSLGPILAERGLTTGKGNLNVSLTYTFADFDRFSGHDTIDLTLHHCLLPECVTNIASPYLKDTIDVEMRFRLKSQTVALSVVYGVNNKLDVGLVVPYTRNDLSVFTHARIVPGPQSVPPDPHEFDPAIETPDQLGTGTAIGIGDIVARAKARVLQRAGVDAAVLADLTLPTGDRQNFLGTGRTRLKATFIASKTIRRFTPHINVGYEAVFGDTKLNSVDYRLGTEIAASPKLTISGELLGVVRPRASSLFQSTVLEGEVLVGRSDIDGVIGGKWKIADNQAFIFNFIVPMSNVGIRASSVVTAGVQFGL